MCQPSKVYDDWITKGFHVHIGRIELVVRPTADGGIVFKRWPPHAARDADTPAAIKTAVQICLPDSKVRDKWRRDLERAMEFVRDFRCLQPRLDALRNGRLFEFHRLLRALALYDEEE